MGTIVLMDTTLGTTVLESPPLNVYLGLPAEQGGGDFYKGGTLSKGQRLTVEYIEVYIVIMLQHRLVPPLSLFLISLDIYTLLFPQWVPTVAYKFSWGFKGGVWI